MSYNKSGFSKEYWLKSTIRIGKPKGKTIEEVLREDRTYVTEFMVKQVGCVVNGIEKVKIIKDSCWGYNAGAGLVCNYSFYRDYIVGRASINGVRIACKTTGLIVEGNTLEEAENKLNEQLDEAFIKCDHIVA